MTALTRYERLEAMALWRSHAGAQRREVLLNLGDATLAILDPGSETALTHWSLTAIERRNPGTAPAIFAPGPDASETLEIEDTDMVEAIATIRRAIARRGPRRGRLRFGVLMVVLVALITGMAAWLPQALVRHASVAAPPAVRDRVGAELMGQIVRLTGPPCSGRPGQAALARLEDRLLERGRLHVLPARLPMTFRLPGGRILLGRDLVEDHDEVTPLAARVIAAADQDRDAFPATLDTLGPRAAVHLLTSGRIPEPMLRRQAERLMRDPPADLAVTPDAGAVVADGAELLLSDGDWVALQQICE